MKRFLPLGVVLLSCLQSLQAQVWQRDPGFNVVLTNRQNALEHTRLVPADGGGMLACGDFTFLDGGDFAARQLARLNSDGSVDTTFRAEIADGECITAAVPLAEGRVLARRRDASGRERVVRFQADGRLDSSFTPVEVGWTGDLVRLTDGSVIAYARSFHSEDTVRTAVARFSATGDVLPMTEAVFRSVRAVWAAPGGKMIVATDVNLPARNRMTPLKADGPPDDSFTANNVAADVYNPIPTVPGARIMRLHADGTPDDAFAAYDVDISARGTFGLPLAVQANGKVVFDTTTRDGDISRSELIRLNANGTRDTSFAPAPDAIETVLRIASRGDGTLVVEVMPRENTVEPARVLVLSDTGAVVSDLSTLFAGTQALYFNAVGTDDRIWVVHGLAELTAGGIWWESERPPLLVKPTSPQLAIITADARSFAPATTRATADALVGVQEFYEAGGKVLLVGHFTRANGEPRGHLARFAYDGTLDGSFAPANVDSQLTSAVFLASDGSVIAWEKALIRNPGQTWYARSLQLFRLRPDGTRDPAFSAGALDPYSTKWHTEMPGAQYLVSAFLPDASREENLRLVRVSATGSIAETLPTRFGGLPSYTSWSPEGTPTTVLMGNPISAVRRLPNGQLLAYGAFSSVNGQPSPGLVKLNADGSVDPSYAPDLGSGTGRRMLRGIGEAGQVLIDLEMIEDGRVLWRTVRLLADGRRDPAYSVEQIATDPRNHVALYKENGVPDLNFPKTFTRADGTEGLIYSAKRMIDGSVWTLSPLARFVPSDVLAITVPPRDVTETVGRDVRFQVAIGTRAPATYQWYFEGAPIAGATSEYLQLTSIEPSQAGSYTVRVEVGGQTLTSEAATLTVVGGTSAVVNVSALARVAPDRTPIAGLTIGTAGGARPWLLRAMGPSLARMGVQNHLVDPAFVVHHGAVEMLRETSGADAVEIWHVAEAVGAFPVYVPYPYPPAWKSVEAAAAPVLEPGSYTVRLLSEDPADGLALFEAYDTLATPAANGLSNASLRVRVGGADGIATLGFVIRGNGPLLVLLRGIGPGLAQFGVSETIAHPKLTLHSPHRVYDPLTNAGWVNDVEIRDASSAVGAFPLAAGSEDAALLLRLEPGAYTVQLANESDASGEGMIEFYIVGR